MALATTLAIGLCTVICIRWFIPAELAPDHIITPGEQPNDGLYHLPVGYVTMDNYLTGLGLINLYLDLIRNINEGLSWGLNLLDLSQLQQIRLNLEGIRFLHELTLNFFNRFIQDWHGFNGEDVIVTHYGELLEQWRDAAERINTLYDQVEQQINSYLS